MIPEAIVNKIALLDAFDGSIVDDDFVDITSLNRGVHAIQENMESILVSDIFFHKVERFRTTDGSKVGSVLTFPDGTGPTGMAIINDLLYICTRGVESVQVFDLSNSAVQVANITVGGECFGVTGKDGTLFATIRAPSFQVVQFEAMNVGDPVPTVSTFSGAPLRPTQAVFRRNNHLLVAGVNSVNEYNEDGSLERTYSISGNHNCIAELGNGDLLLGGNGRTIIVRTNDTSTDVEIVNTLFIDFGAAATMCGALSLKVPLI